MPDPHLPEPADTADHHVVNDAAPPTIDDAPTRDTGNAEPLPSNSLAGRYRIVRLHAKGGLGEVHLAEDLEIGRHVALKLIQPRHIDAIAQRRFIREATLTGGLEHPGIVPVYGLVQDGTGGPCYAMRFVTGESLADAIGRFHAGSPAGAFESGEFRKLLGQFVAVCQAVAFAHSKGVIHRDLKPANVMLGAFGEVLTVDWGLAKRVNEDGAATLDPAVEPSSNSDQTQAGEAVGTPVFMAPEQAAGRWDEVGPAADVYSLGATLYTLLTGAYPFTGTVAEVLNQVQAGTFRRPSEVTPAVPKALEAVCLKAMARNRNERYPSAQALLADVEHWLADEPVQAYPEPWLVQARRWMRRHRTLVTSAMAAIVLAVPILLSATLLLRAANVRESKAKSEAIDQKARADRNADRARAAVDEYFLKVSQDQKLRDHGLQPLRRQLLDLGRTYYEQFVAEAKDDPSLRHELATAYARLAAIQSETEAKAQAIPLVQQSLAMFEQLRKADPANVTYRGKWADITRQLGNLRRQTGDMAEANRLLLSAVNELGELHRLAPAGGAFATSQAACLDELGQVAIRTGEHRVAEEYLQRGRKILDGLVTAHPTLAIHQERLADIENSIGILYAGTGQAAEALAAFQRSLAIRERLAQEHPSRPEYQSNVAVSHFNLGHFHRATGRPTEAEASWKKSLAINEALTLAHPFVLAYQKSLAKDHHVLGAHYQTTGKSEAAAKSYERALDFERRLVRADPSTPEHHIILADTLNNLGYLHYDEDRYEPAEERYRELLNGLRQLLKVEPNVPAHRNRLAAAHNNLGLVYRDTQRSAEAVAAFRASLAIREELVKEHPTVIEYIIDRASNFNNLGVIARVQGDADQALKRFDQSIQSLEQVLRGQPGHPAAKHYLGQAQLGRARALIALQRYADAVTAFDVALKLPTRFDPRLIQLFRAVGVAKTGDPLAAAVQAEELVKGSRDGQHLFEAARVMAAASGATRSVDAAAADRLADRAVELLRQSRSTGYLNDTQIKVQVTNDRIFDSLRLRKAFQEFANTPK
jgi:serine/threonine-protein kinase